MSTKKKSQNSCKAYCNPPRKKSAEQNEKRTHKPLRTPTASPNLTSLAIKKDFGGDWGDPISFTLYQIGPQIQKDL